MIKPADLDAFTRGQSEPPARGKRRASYPAELHEQLIRGDEAGAWLLLNQSMASGMTPDEVLLDVVSPAMRSVGDGWAEGNITVAQEHQASATAQRLVARLGPHFSRRGRKRAHIIVGTAPGEAHDLPTAMMRDLLRGHAFDVTDLGANVPVDSWATTVRDATESSPILLAVGICATSPDNDEALSATISVVHATADVPVFLGGHAIRDVSHALAFGADLYTATAFDVLAACDALLLPPST